MLVLFSSCRQSIIAIFCFVDVKVTYANILSRALAACLGVI
jgi:hypothetical protein